MGLVCRSHDDASLQSGLPEEHHRAFDLELGSWFPALTWLIKEFRLRVGYETPDEEAGIRFWMDRFERTRSGYEATVEPQVSLWMQMDDETSTQSVPSEVQEARVSEARSWPREAVERRMFQLFELRRKICPTTPILVPMASQLGKRGV
ncbi:unnamed protein product, partial [Polarella glacialis]